MELACIYSLCRHPTHTHTHTLPEVFGSVVLQPSSTSESRTQMHPCTTVKIPPRSWLNKSGRRRRSISPHTLPNARSSPHLCFQWMECIEMKLVQPVNAWLSSSHNDGSDPTELCVTMSGPVYHWLWYEQPACSSGVPVTPQPEHPVFTPMMEQGLHYTSASTTSHHSHSPTLPAPGQVSLPQGPTYAPFPLSLHV